MERPEKRNYNTATPKQKQHGDQGAKGGKEEKPYQKPKDTERKQQGKSSIQGVPKGKETKASEWLGPDIMGEPSNTHDGDPRDHGEIGGRDGGEAPDHIPSLDLATTLQECGYTINTRGNNHARRGTFPNARGGARGAGHFTPGGGRGSLAFRNYMSTNQYYSLMANGDYDVDGCGESEASEMEVQPPTEVIASTPLCIEGGNEYQAIEFQGDFILSGYELTLLIMSLNFMFWNVRGIANAPTQNVLKRLIKTYNVGFLAIMEPLTPPNPERYSKALGLVFKGSNSNGKIWVFVEEGADFVAEDDSEQILHGRFLSPG